MRDFRLKYGRDEIPVDFDPEKTIIVGRETSGKVLSDPEIGERFDQPIDSAPLEDVVSPGDSVLFVVPDATRATAAGQVVNLLVRRLIAHGIMPHDLRIIFATGIHRRVTDAEKKEILTPFIAQRIATLDHDARDLMKLAGLDSNRFVSFGEFNGVPVEINRAVRDFDHVVLIGGAGFHYFAGFTGGRKLICPGLASATTIAATHRLAFDFETMSRRAGVGAGLLDGNAVHAAFQDICGRVAPRFAVTTIVDETGAAVEVFAGHWETSHRAACDEFARRHFVTIPEKRATVVVSCGGFPHDINLIQAHKALETATEACFDGGRIILVAECADGLGRSDFEGWFDAPDAAGVAARLAENYEVNGQTAWSLREKTGRFDVEIVTSLSAEMVAKMGFRKITPDQIPADADYILPSGAKFRPIIED